MSCKLQLLIDNTPKPIKIWLSHLWEVRTCAVVYHQPKILTNYPFKYIYPFTQKLCLLSMMFSDQKFKYHHTTECYIDTKRWIWKSAGKTFLWNLDIFLFCHMNGIIAHNFSNFRDKSITNRDFIKENVHFLP